MKRIKYVTIFILLLYAHQSYSQQGNINALPLYNKEQARSIVDWLVTPTAQKSTVYRTSEGYLVLSNGLISRTFSIAPNGATIGLDNIVTNEALVRSVSPEATLWINGKAIKVGGLIGQPIKNYLLPEWVASMKADPQSLKLISWDTSPLKARFEWKQRAQWLSQTQSWPPKGLELTFTYKADTSIIHQYHDQPVDAQRKVIWKDDFLTISPKWKLITGTGENKMSFTNEGKAGEMLGTYNNVAYGEQSLPQNVKVITCKLNTGTDLSNSYGPGVALTFPDGKNIKFYLSPGDSQFAVNNKGILQTFPGFRPSRSCYLRIELIDHQIILGVSETGTNFRTLTTLFVESRPLLIRVGKTDPIGNNIVENTIGVLGRSKIEKVEMLGEPDIYPDQFLANLTVKVHYEMYDGLPLIDKWVTVENNSEKEVILNNLSSEQLEIVEGESAVERKQRWALPPIFAQSDFAFHSMSSNASENACVEWKTDSTYTTQVNYELKTPVILQCMPKHGINQEVSIGKPFESMRLWELIYDNDDRERRNLAQRKMYRCIAPWTIENPIIMHVTSVKDEAVKKAIDQCAEVGFEMVILTFGSGFNMEDTSATNLERMKKLRVYATSKNIGLGGYSLLASRSIDSKNDVIMPDKTSAIFGNSPCLQSEWGRKYFQKLYHFFEQTGFDLLEHDGSYPGDVCASTTHPGHHGLEDSQWKQFTEIRDFYSWCCSKGIYLNVPDWYFLVGSNKIAMGYRETNWSLPREYQEIIERQNIFDGTWEKTPSMGWMFVPLVQYHGGGDAATIEPFKEHLSHYGQRLANLFGAGVQACFRGPQLYDAPETKALVTQWVRFYKKHRHILDADIIHLRRPDGRDYDAILHADPSAEEKGLLMVYNPLNEPITRTLVVDLYYTGLKRKAQISEQDQKFKSIKLDGSKAIITMTIPAKNQTWFVIK